MSKEQDYLKRLANNDYGRHAQHEHCFHLRIDPIMMVIPPGHVPMQCCECNETKTFHRDHRPKPKATHL